VLVYASAWLKCHYPAAFACAILNSQPMGFYAPAQLVRDARDHGVEVRPVDVNRSFWDYTLEPDKAGGTALRLGFRQIKGFREADAEALVAARAAGDFASMHRLARASGLGRAAIETLANADGWGSLALDRRAALWQAKGLDAGGALPLFAAAERRGAAPEPAEPAAALPAMSLGEEVTEDYRHLRLSLKTHPLALLRETLAASRVVPSRRLSELRDGARVAVAGIVLIRQQPDTASGVIFMTLEDETGVANVVVWPGVFARFRRALLASQLVLVRGPIQRDESGLVIHVVAERIEDQTHLLRALAAPPDPASAPPARIVPAARDFR
jgi:error-prone DNA polymerase